MKTFLKSLLQDSDLLIHEFRPILVLLIDYFLDGTWFARMLVVIIASLTEEGLIAARWIALTEPESSRSLVAAAVGHVIFPELRLGTRRYH
jgi:hypothetical protein